MSEFSLRDPTGCCLLSIFHLLPWTDWWITVHCETRERTLGSYSINQPSLDKSISLHFSLSLPAVSPARMSCCLLELMWLKYPSGFSLRSGTQPLDPLQFSFLALKSVVAKWILLPHPILHIFQGHLSLVRKDLERRHRGESPGLNCLFTSIISDPPLSSLRSFNWCSVMCYSASCWHFPECWVILMLLGIYLPSRRNIFFAFVAERPRNPSFLLSFLLFPCLFSWIYLTFCPFLIPNSELSSKDTHHRPNCAPFPLFLLPVTSPEQAYTSHNRSQEWHWEHLLTHVSLHWHPLTILKIWN